MKKLLILLVFPFFSYTQTQVDTCFTPEEIQDISFVLDSLYELDSLNKIIIARQEKLVSDLKTVMTLDSLELAYRVKQIDLLNENIDLYIERERHLKPKWWEHKAIWFTAGILTTVFSAKLVDEVVK
jgi:hypothetical protein